MPECLGHTDAWEASGAEKVGQSVNVRFVDVRKIRLYLELGPYCEVWAAGNVSRAANFDNTYNNCRCKVVTELVRDGSVFNI